MVSRIFLSLLFLFLLTSCCERFESRDVPLDKEEYLDEREDLINEDRSFRRSADLQLTDLEVRADAILQHLKQDWDSLATHEYPPAQRFHEVKAEYDTSPLLNVMQRLPKGAMLHTHPSATGSFDLLMHATYDSAAWIYLGQPKPWQPYRSLAYSDTLPGEHWVRIIDERAK